MSILVPSSQTIAHLIAAAGHSLIDAVVSDFIKEMVQAALVRAAYVHTGAAADGFPTAQNLNILGCISIAIILIISSGCFCILGHN